MGFRRWRKHEQTQLDRKDGGRGKGGASTIQRILHTTHFFACLLSAATGMAFYLRAPFPEDNIFLGVMAIRWASAFSFSNTPTPSSSIHTLPSGGFRELGFHGRRQLDG